MTSTSALPETMYALQLVKQGAPEEAFEYRRVKVPIIKKPTDILVNVKAAGVNPAEGKFRSGNVMSISVPRTMGCDYSGVVMAKGSKVTEFEVGDAVFGVLDNLTKGPEGTYAEYIVASLGSGVIAKKPENISFEEAASLGAVALTAMQGIGIHGNFLSQDKDTKPKRVLIVGASGGIGVYATQFAKALGAQEVLGICGSKNASLVQSLGADQVFDYTSTESMDTLLSSPQYKDLEVILDCIGGDDYYNQLRPLLKPKTGVYCTAVGPIIHLGSQPAGVSDWAHVISRVVWRKFFGPCPYILFRGIPWEKMKTDIRSWLAEGIVRPVVGKDQVFDLKEGAKAHVLLDSLHASGRIILKIPSSSSSS
ncbi:chaperonin 10-like protein [Phascolomyces articulosus]|uniref:Chaperonin 10-like protein n=1 Tax=Phascolomyces articulosus TaxID=60185 RepID=A0AAD5K3A2_9FUNG|nr:chaperonin 10-like protein [Phascolomyces articulosus]